MKSRQDENTRLKNQNCTLTELISAKVIDSLVIERLILKLEQVSAIQTRKLFPYLLGTRTKSIQTVTLIFFFF